MHLVILELCGYDSGYKYAFVRSASHGFESHSSDNLVMLNATPRGEPRWIQREINEMTAEVLSFPRGRPWILFEYVNVQEDSDMSVL
jgi:hypothetical protein